MIRIGLDFLSALGMSPVTFIELAARLECQEITLAAGPISFVAELYEPWTFRDNPGLVSDTRKALSDNGIAVSGGEGWFILPRFDIARSASDLDIMAELGAPAVTVCGIDPDLARTFDQIALLTELAAARGIGTNVEFVAGLPIGSIADALAVVAHVGRPEIGLVIDAMHLYRSGATSADLTAIDAGLIRHAQICDAPTVATMKDYGYEASFERLPPGEGELPLAGFIAALPRHDIIGLEIPMKARALAGEDAAYRLGPCVEATRALIATTRPT